MISCCYELKNKQKFSELGRERMSDDFMELNDVELNFRYFDDEADSDDTSKNTKCGGFFLLELRKFIVFI